MVDREAFIRTVIENPDDDGPRLVFADWLEEQGECAASEFIRVQIERSLIWPEAFFDKTGRGKESDAAERERAVSLGRREAQLQPAMGRLADMWARHLKLPGPGRIFGWSFRRGFIESVSLSHEDWRDKGDSILDTQPVTVVKLTGYFGSRQSLEARWPKVKCWNFIPDVNSRSESVSQEGVSITRGFDFIQITNTRPSFILVRGVPGRPVRTEGEPIDFEIHVPPPSAGAPGYVFYHGMVARPFSCRIDVISTYTMEVVMSMPPTNLLWTGPDPSIYRYAWQGPMIPMRRDNL